MARSAGEDLDGADGPVLSADRTRTLFGIPWRDWAMVLGLLTGYAVLLTYLSNLRSENFFTSAWDLGISQQFLWTTAHGRLLYETADLEFYGAHSFLQVHSTYIAFLIVPLYAAAPYPLTLFALQSAVFSLSGIPLYFLARTVLERRSLAVALVALYLASFAITSALMYDFHWEAFLPVEFLTFYLLVERRHYALSLVPLVLGTLTLEVFPFLAGAVAVLVLVERGQALGFRWPALRHDRTSLVMVGMLVVALVAYAAIRWGQYVAIPALLGVPSVTGGGPAGVSLFLGLGANSTTLPHSLAYWSLLLATLGFLPLLSPRHLILSIPWFLFSVLAEPLFSAHFGDAPALIAFPALAVAAVFGLREVRKIDWADARSLLFVALVLVGTAALTILALVPGGSARLLGYSAGPIFWVCVGFLTVVGVLFVVVRHIGWPKRGGRALTFARRIRKPATASVIVAVFVTILVFDTAMSPFNTANFGATPVPGYEFRFGENPTSSQMPFVVSYLSPNSQVLASDRLFPYVANDPNAWPIPWFVISPQNPVPGFPFTPTQLPQFVLLDAQEFSLVPVFLQNDLFNASLYGLVAYVYATWSPGTIYLFERGYQGPTAARDLASGQSVYEYTYANLSVGSSGAIVADPTSSSGEAITSVPTGPVNGTMSPVWYGPYQTFLPGNYTVTFNVKGTLTNLTEASQPIAYLDGTWQGSQNISSFFRVAINSSELSEAQWRPFEFPLRLAYPFPTVEFRGLLALLDGRSIGSISLESIVVRSVPA